MAFLYIWIFICLFNTIYGYGAYSDQPKIVTENGHMYIYSAENGNISLMTSGNGYVNINNENLGEIIVLAEKAVNKLDKFKGIGDFQANLNELRDDIQVRVLNRIKTLEYHFGTFQNGTYVPFMTRASNRKIKLDILRLLRRVNKLKTSLDTLRSKLTTNNCESNPCKHGATCYPGFQSFHCICPKNWEGEQCDIDVDECARFKGTDLGCQNGATCVNTPGSYNCICQTNWFGTHCTKRTFDCASSNSAEMCGHGICVNQGSGFICICDQGWKIPEGKGGSQVSCSQDVDECASKISPCSHDPYVPCINTPGSFQCGSCPKGYSGNGYQCSDIDECQNDNGGCSSNPLVQCINTMGSRVCGPCPPGYSGNGQTCETVQDLCTINNGGCNSQSTCVFNPGMGQVECICPLGYVGSGIGPNGCVENKASLDGCASSPCQNGGRCLPSLNNSSYTCHCTPAFTGNNCEKTHTNCLTNPCLNGGTCKVYQSPHMAYEYFWCRCAPGYSGRHCQNTELDCVGTFTDPNGNFSWNPIFDEIRINSTKYRSCSWTIKTEESKALLVNFTTFDFPGSLPMCSSTYSQTFKMEIFDGNTRDSNTIGRYCGDKIPKPFTSTTNIIKIDVNGFMFWPVKFSLTWETTERKCGDLIVVETHGTLMSPGSPGPYPKNSNCVWNLLARPGKRIQLTFFSLDIEKHNNCSYDYLEIREGNDKTSPVLMKFCNSTTPPPIITSSNRAFIHFHSDNNTEGKGFQLSYISIPSIPGCGGTLTAPSGRISLHSLSLETGSYQGNLFCEWLIQLPGEETIKVDFKEFSIEYHKTCMYDKLQIYDGPNTDSKLIGRWCGDTIPSSFTSSSNYLTIVFQSDSSDNKGNFILDYNSVCGGVFTEKTGIIRSPYYPDHYPQSRICYFMIKLPPKNYIVLNFLDFDIEERDMDTYGYGCVFDSLTVYDGDSVSSPIKGSFCGNTTPNAITSTHNILFLKFVSDESDHGRGFLANYSSYDLNCGGIYTEPNGIVEKTKDNKYYTSNECLWVISAPPNHVVQITWATFNSPTSFLCMRSYVTIFDNVTSPSDTNQLGERYCGSNIPPPITSMSNILLIKSHHVRSTDELSFKAFYTSEGLDSSCVRSYVSSVGTILSPKYPKSYPKNSNCVWTITVPNGKQIRLIIHDFDLENHPRCLPDYLEIRNGGTKTSPLIGRYCGKKIIKEITSHTNQLYLNFVSDIMTSGTGFKISWDGSSSGCGGSLTASTGGIISPNYPQPYGRNTVCYWKISTSIGNTLQLTLVDVDLEMSLSCRSDFIEVYDGKDRNSKSLGRFCHVDNSRTIESTGNNLYIKFRSDISIQGRGFHVTYGTVCNRTLTGFRGSIESPNFPMSSGTPNNCLWVLKAPIGNRLNLVVSHFIMETNLLGFWLRGNQSCFNGYLEIYEETGDKLLPKYCKKDDIPQITSKTNTVNVHYMTSIYSRRSSFRLDWEVSGCGGVFKDREEGEFTSPGYPLGYNVSVICEWYFTVPLGHSIVFEVDVMEIESSQDCTFDYLRIFGGIDDTGPPLASLCHPLSDSQPWMVTTTGNHAFVRFESDHSFKSKGFHARFTTNTEGCGGSYTSTSGQFASKNYPNNYGSVDDCIYYISVPSSLSINLTFTVFDINSDENCTNAFVEISDSNSVTLGRYCGQVLLPSIFSSGSTLTVRHKSNGGTAIGFLASYNILCGSVIQLEHYGSLSSDNVRPEFLSYDGINCTWTFIADSSDNIIITFTSLRLKAFDSKSGTIDIYVGDEKDGQLFRRLTGNKTPPTMVVPSSIATLVFQHEYGSTFNLDYAFADTFCGGNINTEEGKIISPNFPDNYPNNNECIWNLNLSPGNTLSVVFSVLKIDASDNCTEDFIEIRRNNNAGKLIGVYCGEEIPEKIITNTSLWIMFRTSDQDTSKGFELDYTLSHGGTLYGPSGEIGNPKYPSMHEATEKEYTWTIQVSSGSAIMITVVTYFTRSTIDNDGSCDDGLQIFDGINAEAPLLKTLCQPVPPFNSKTNAVFILYKSTIQSSKFLLSWQEIDRTLIPKKPKTDLCHTRQFITEDENILFTSPGFPHGYSSNLECEWIFETYQQNHISITFDIINLEYPGRFQTSCRYGDTITLYDLDKSEKEDKIASVCNSNSTSIPFEGSNLVKVKFTSDFSGNGTGFSATAAAICGGSLTDSVGVIKLPKQKPGEILTCQWNITVKPGQKIAIRFSKFKFPASNPSCSQGYVMIRNGGYPDSPFLDSGKFCGTKTPSELTTSSNKAFILFKQSSHEDIEITYEGKSVQCGEKIYLSQDGVKSITINTPNYPNVPQPHIQCKWIILTNPGESIHFQLTDKFEMGYSDDCSQEYLEIREGSSEMGHLLGRYCTTNPPFILTETNALFVKYYSDTPDPKDGFRATVSLEKCGGTFFEQYEGTIYTPGYPNTYDNNITCVWKLKSETGVGFKITIPKMYLGYVGASARANFEAFIDNYDSFSITEVKTNSTKWFFGAVNETIFETEDYEVLITLRSRQLKDNLSSKRAYGIHFRRQYLGCGSKIFESSGELKSPGYPNQVGNKHCYWKITAPYGKRVSLTFTDFDLPDTSHHLNYLAFYNRAYLDHNLINSFTGFRPNGTTVESFGNIMGIYYSCEECETHHGFKLTYTTSKSAGCSGMLEETQGKKIFKGSANVSFDCEWRHKKTPTPTTITFIISGNITKPSSDHCFSSESQIMFTLEYDFMAIFCGNSETFNTYSLSTISKDMSIEASGRPKGDISFEINWKIDQCGSENNSIDEISFNLESPGFPANYQPNMDCVWLLSTIEWGTLKIRFNNFTLESDCENDYLEFNNGLEVLSPHINKFCGTIIPGDMITSENNVRIHLHTNSIKQYQGFNITLSLITYGCGGLQQGLSGVLTSPQYPELYENNLECEWHLETPQGYHIGSYAVNRFEIETSQDCQNDYLEFFDFVDGKWNSMGKKCGRSWENTMNSTSNKMKVLFRANEKNTGNGFMIKWEANCGGIIVADSKIQHLLSPGYPKNYIGPFTCNYTIIAPKKYIKGHFNSFEIEDAAQSECKFDYVQITTNTLLRTRKYPKTGIKYCGKKTPNDFTSYDSVSIIFSADIYGNLPGFDLEYSIEDCGGLITSAPNIIESPKRDLLSAMSLTNCTWRIVAPKNQIIIFKIKHLQLRISPKCSREYIKIYPSSNSTNVLGNFCGYLNTKTDTFRAQSNEATVEFFSEYLYLSSRFKIIVNFGYGESSKCGGKIDLNKEQKLSFSSKDFDSDAILDCSWTIKTPENAILLTINNLNIQQSLQNCTNYFKIYDGLEHEDEIGILCTNTNGYQRISSGNTMTITIYKLSAQVSFDLTFKSHPTPCGTTVLNVTDTPQILTSPGYPSNYSTNLHCIWQLKSENRRIHIHLEEIDIQSNSGNCTNDQLIIDDIGSRESSVLFAVSNFDSSYYIGTDRYVSEKELKQRLENPSIPLYLYNTFILCGKKVFSDFYFSSKYVQIKLYSDFASTGRGFKLSYVAKSCTRNYTSDNGRIQEMSISSCKIFIFTQPNSTISLYFKALRISYGGDCNIASFKVYDGNNMVLNSCSYGVPSPIFSTGPVIMIDLKTKNTGGFDLTYTTTDKGPGCGGNLMSFEGIFTSPFYPKNYRNYSSCEWYIRSIYNYKPTLEFRVFNLGPKETCSTDYLEIYDVKEETRTLRGTFCGQDDPAKIIGVEDTLLVLYKTSVHNGGSGFYAHFSHQAQYDLLPSRSILKNDLLKL